MHPLSTSAAAARRSGGARPRLVKIALVAGLLTGGLGLSAQAAEASAPIKVKIKHQTLEVEGTQSGDRIALRQSAADRQTLQVDVGDDGSADFQVSLTRFNRIRVDAGRGDDLVRVDETSDAFTATTPTEVNGQQGNDTLIGGSGPDTLNGDA